MPRYLNCQFSDFFLHFNSCLFTFYFPACNGALSKDPSEDEQIESHIFQHDRLDNAIFSTVVTSDPTHPRGRPPSDEITCRLNGIVLRDRLRDCLQEHNMY